LPAALNRFEFVIVSSLRAAQLMRGCTPRVAPGHKLTVTARHEVSQGKIQATRTRLPDTADGSAEGEPPPDDALTRPE
jgi:DNA-directed RNA polymerase subunit K/omega